MDNENAIKLFNEGGVFIFLNVPEGTEFGIDLKSWNVGEKFRGVKMIPPGLHFIFYSSINAYGETAPRRGFFHYFHSGEMLVKKWDPKNECISKEMINDEVVKLKENLIVLDQFLGPYPFDIYEKWKNLTTNITENIVIRLVPTCGEITSALELESCSDADRPRGIKDANHDKGESSQTSKRRKLWDNLENLPNLKPISGTNIRLTVFPEKKFPNNATPAEITKHCLDSTYLLETLLEKYETPNDLLGELEFCFICFLIGHSLEAFEHWKKIIDLLCSCEEGIEKYWRIYSKLLTILELQVKEIPEEFLADIVANNNFVYVKLKQLFRSIKSCNVDGELKTKCQRLQKNLSDYFMWDFMHLDEDEDEAPVIVELEN